MNLENVMLSGIKGWTSALVLIKNTSKEQNDINKKFKKDLSPFFLVFSSRYTIHFCLRINCKILVRKTIIR